MSHDQQCESYSNIAGGCYCHSRKKENRIKDLESQLATAKAEIERLRDEEKPFQRIHIDTLQSENKRLREALENISRIQQIGDLPQESRYYQAQWDNCRAIACAALGARKAWNQ